MCGASVHSKRFQDHYRVLWESIWACTKINPAGCWAKAKCVIFLCLAHRVTAAKTLLLYGPEGSGKKTLASCLANYCGATFLDLSPWNTDGKFLAKEVTLMVHMVWADYYSVSWLSRLALFLKLLCSSSQFSLRYGDCHPVPQQAFPLHQFLPLKLVSEPDYTVYERCVFQSWFRPLQVPIQTRPQISFDTYFCFWSCLLGFSETSTMLKSARELGSEANLQGEKLSEFWVLQTCSVFILLAEGSIYEQLWLSASIASRMYCVEQIHLMDFLRRAGVQSCKAVLARSHSNQRCGEGDPLYWSIIISDTFLTGYMRNCLSQRVSLHVLATFSCINELRIDVQKMLFA